MDSTDWSDEYLTPDDLCALLKLKKQTIYKQRSQGTGPPGHKFGKHIRFKRSDVEEWIKSKRDFPAED